MPSIQEKFNGTDNGMYPTLRASDMMDYPMDDNADLVVETGCAVRYGIEANAALIHHLILKERVVLSSGQLLVKELELRKCMTELYIDKPVNPEAPISTSALARLLFEKYGPYLEGQLQSRNLTPTDAELAQVELRILNLINTILDDLR